MLAISIVSTAALGALLASVKAVLRREAPFQRSPFLSLSAG